MFYSVPSKPLGMILDNQDMEMKPKKFKSGSVGWYLGGKVMLQGMKVQLSFSAVIVGSKPPAGVIDVRTEDDLLSMFPENAIKPPETAPEPKKGKRSRRPRKGL